MDKWEHDIGETLELEDWCKMAQYTSKTYDNTSIIEANYNFPKVVHGAGESGILCPVHLYAVLLEDVAWKAQYFYT